jgi:acetyl esterase/lipase
MSKSLRLGLVLVFCFGVSHAGEIRNMLDVPYGPSPSQKLDVWWNPENANAPIVYMVHGGGWRQGDKRSYSRENFAELITEMGCVLVSTNYRLLGNEEQPSAFEVVQDVWRGLAWARDHADEFGANKDRILVGGASAGSHLSACLAYGDKRAWLAGTPFEGREAEIRSSIRGWYGDSCALRLEGNASGRLGTNALAMKEQFHPVDELDAGEPPAFCVNGDADALTPLAGVLAFQKRAESVGVPCEVAVIPDGAHMIGTQILMFTSPPTKNNLPERLRDKATFAAAHERLTQQFRGFVSETLRDGL